MAAAEELESDGVRRGQMLSWVRLVVKEAWSATLALWSSACGIASLGQVEGGGLVVGVVAGCW